MKTFTVYLYRHGITKGNLNAQYIGHTDLPLTSDSVLQLRNIKARCHYPDVSAVFTSPLKRSLDSANIMFPKNNPLCNNELIEYDFGEFEGLTAEELKDNDDFKAWMQGDMNLRPPFGRKQCRIYPSRLLRFLEKIVDGLIQNPNRNRRNRLPRRCVDDHSFVLRLAGGTDGSLANGSGLRL